MTANGDIPNGAVASIARRPPVRVKLRRINADLAKAYPPDGETSAWWERLKRAPRHEFERFRQFVIGPIASSGPATIWRHFRNRRAMIEAAIARAYRQAAALTQGVFSGVSAPRRRSTTAKCQYGERG
jgi:hypothetical protein